MSTVYCVNLAVVVNLPGGPCSRYKKKNHIGSNMADDVSDVVWPRGIFEAKGGHHQKEHKKLWFSL